MNDDPLAYSQFCEMQISDAVHFLEKYSSLIKWAKDAKILEIGCAEGTITFESLLPRIPSDFQKLTLVDISAKLLNFARERINDPRINCLEMDITGEIPLELQEHFDHIFSFYCLQCINEESTPQAMKNIFDMLKPGGTVLMSIIVTSPLYDISRNMMKRKKWPSCMSCFENIISPYHGCENPEDKLEQFLKKSGFEISVCKYEEKTYTYDNWDNFLGFALSIVPFAKITCETERRKFIEDFVAEAKQFSRIKIDKDNGVEKIQKSYSRLIAVAARPSRI